MIEIDDIYTLSKRVCGGYAVTEDDAARLMSIRPEDTPRLNALLESADRIREHFCGKTFNLCTILNAKSGRCSENCAYCAQSVHYKTNADVYPLVTKEKALQAAQQAQCGGAHRFSLVTSGRGLASDSPDLEKLQAIYAHVRMHTKIGLCASHGICSLEALQKLKESGVGTYHHNLESSERFYPRICSTHSFADRVDTIRRAHKAGLQVCSGGIFGLGETEQDRIDMAFSLRSLNVHSVPINILTPIPGTPLEKAAPLCPEEILKDIAIFRFILPKAFIRYAGGRVKLGALAERGLRGGVNSALTGNFLTTSGSTVESDKRMILQAGFEL